MPGHHLGLVMATLLEAEPLIGALGFEEEQAGPFGFYRRPDMVLVISGIGKAAAAAATAWLIMREDPAIIINLGAAGALSDSWPLGTILAVSRVVEPDRLDLITGRPKETCPQIARGFKQAVLATMDSPARSASERAAIAGLADLIDMEGAAVLQTAGLFAKPCHLFKFVSDTPANHAIRANIASLREQFSVTISELLQQGFDRC